MKLKTLKVVFDIKIDCKNLNLSFYSKHFKRFTLDDSWFMHKT